MEAAHDYLEAYLRAMKAKPASILQWNEKWLEALEGALQPMPCPHCFINGRISRLVPRPTIDGQARAGCKTCSNTFGWPAEG